MEVLETVLRIAHIFTGVFWAGAAITVAAFIEPSLRAMGPDGGKFVEQFVSVRKFSVYMGVASLITVATGGGLFAIVYSDRLGMEWVGSVSGISIIVGSLAGIVAFAEGMLVNRPTGDRMAVLGAQMKNAAGPPAPEVVAEMQALQERLRKAGVNSAILLCISIIGMSLAHWSI
ncbi:MAG: hypothetical protein AAB281_04530 [Actinomycetota bacterium]